MSLQKLTHTQNKVLLSKVKLVIYRDINAGRESPLEYALCCSPYKTLSLLSKYFSNFSLHFQDLSVYFDTPMSRGCFEVSGIKRGNRN